MPDRRSASSLPALLLLLAGLAGGPLAVAAAQAAAQAPPPTGAPAQPAVPPTPPPAPALVTPAPALPFGIPNASRPEVDLLAAGQPTREQLAALAAAGYRTVVDLRAPGEERGYDEAGTTEALGMTYRSAPLVSDTLDAANLRELVDVLAEAERPVLLHCSTSNRVGALYYAYLVLEEEVAPATALERARAAGLRGEALAEKVQALGRELAAAPN